MNEHPIILFDGVCNLCDKAVQFIISKDPEACFRFAAMQSLAGQALLARHGLTGLSTETMVLIDGMTIRLCSDAVIEIARRLPGGWSRLAWLVHIPKGLRDAGYRLLARNRFRWFGKKQACLLPGDEIRRRFLD
jgi:predicted DCC family thiol-disulfide oxidoreductase YuxK